MEVQGKSFASNDNSAVHPNIMSMEIKIRKAKKEDLEAIIELNKQLADYHRKIDRYYKPSSEKRKSFKNYLFNLFKKRSARILVAENDGKVIGCFIGIIEKPKPFIVPAKIGKISSAFVEEKYRELGIGKKMFDELIKWFKRNKIKHVELSVDSRNETAIRTWQNFGFKEFMKKMRLDL